MVGSKAAPGRWVAGQTRLPHRRGGAGGPSISLA